MTPDVMGIPEAAEFVKVHPGSLRRLASEGRIPARKVGREWRFSRLALLDWLAGDGEVIEAADRDDRRLDATAAAFVNQAIRQ